MPLIEHLAELRNRLIWSLAAFTVAIILCFFVWEPIYDFLTIPLCNALTSRGQPCELVFLSVQEGFFLAFSISLMAGLVLSFPIISYQMWRFVAPGLYRSEKQAFLPFLIASPVLFLMGCAFAFYVLLPMVYNFFLGFQQFGAPPVIDPVVPPVTAPVTAPGTVPGAEPSQDITIQYLGTINEYLSLTMKFMVAFGLCFQLPVALTLMGLAGLVSARGLAKFRRYALVCMLVVAAFVTPGPDVMSQVILFAAIYPLYEISILLVRFFERKREAELRAQGLWDEEAAGES